MGRRTRQRDDASGGRPRRRGWLRRLAAWALVAAIWGGLGAAGLLAYHATQLPPLDGLGEGERRASVRLLARDGSLLAAFGDLYGEPVTLADLPPALPQAALAAEDRRFYDHFGVDLLGIARAAWANLRAGAIVQGGSTITQQLAKNLFLTPERTLERKIRELLLALWLEQRFSKEQILALYLNRVYLGAGTYGVDAAARRYFGKPAREVGLYEAAMLVGLLKAPSRYNPAADPEAARRRAAVVLEDMVEAGYITAAEAARARQGDARTQAAEAWRGRYFADWVLQRVRGYVGYRRRDLVVHTTLAPRLQRLAEAEVAAALAGPAAGRAAGQAALVSLAPDGAVRAMVGGADYADSQFNRAVQARRQPGSAFKPFVYLAAFEAGMAPDATVRDAPVEVDGWRPENYGGRYHGEVTLREAFARSLNSVAVRLIRRLGPEAVARTARRLGISAELEAAPSLALGTSEVSLLDLTAAYAVFANRGRGVWPYGIERIETAGGGVLYERQGGGPGRVVAPRDLARMTDVMRASVAWGTGRGADPGRPAAGKTGTSQDFRDAWFVGFTAELVTGVWFGNDDGRPMQGVTGGTLPARLWRRYTRAALAGEPARPLPGAAAQVAEDRRGDGGEGLIARILQRLGAGGGAPTGDDSDAPAITGQPQR